MVAGLARHAPRLRRPWLPALDPGAPGWPVPALGLPAAHRRQPDRARPGEACATASHTSRPGAVDPVPPVDRVRVLVAVVDALAQFGERRACNGVAAGAVVAVVVLPQVPAGLDGWIRFPDPNERGKLPLPSGVIDRKRARPPTEVARFRYETDPLPQLASWARERGLRSVELAGSAGARAGLCRGWRPPAPRCRVIEPSAVGPGTLTDLFGERLRHDSRAGLRQRLTLGRQAPGAV
jgi:hypothetical protein